jgi:alpha-D-xyloside xylohydrolase
MSKKGFFLFVTVLILGSCGAEKSRNSQFDFTKGLEKVASGVWKAEIGNPDKVNLLSELDFNPKIDAINNIEAAELPVDKAEITAEVFDGKTYIRFPLDKEEKIYGLGLNFQSVQQRGRIARLHVDHYGGSDNGRTHAPVPFFVSSKGYGVLINAARYIDVYAGTSVRKDTKNPPVLYNRNTDQEWSAQPYSDNLEFLVPAEGVELVFFSGKSMLDVVRRFNLYNGGGVLPPKWGLGFWHRVPTLFSEEQVKEEVGEFKKRGFPLSVIGLEPGWMTRAYPCTYQWDPGRFPNPEAFVKDMAAQDIKVNLWVNPGVAPDCEIASEIEPYTGTHTEWNGMLPDYSMAQTKKIMGDHFSRNAIDKGVSGFKMDENDGYDFWVAPDVAKYPSGISGEQMRQIYGSLMQSFMTGLYRRKNERTYGLVRAGNAGTTSYPFVIYNDYYNHRDFITALINSSFIGVLWTPEVRASKTSEEWLRRMQTVCFSPLAMLNAWADGTKPWSFADVEKQVRQVMMLRMSLIPYLYTTFAHYAFDGIPPVRAMCLEPGCEADPKDQFMVGESLLVAPLFAGETSRKVILPKGKWYDFYTGDFVGDGETVSVEPGLDKIPVFVKDGGIIPMYEPMTTLPEGPVPVSVRHYGVKASSFDLYDDDGRTYDYEKGEFTWIRLVADPAVASGKATVLDDGTIWSFNDYEFKFMTK